MPIFMVKDYWLASIADEIYLNPGSDGYPKGLLSSVILQRFTRENRS